MKIRPKGPYVLIEIPPVEEISPGGIVTKTASVMKREHDGRDIGTIIELGPQAFKSLDGCNSPEEWGVKEGDFVEFHRYDGKIPRLAEDREEFQRYRLILDKQIIAAMEEK